MTASVPLSRDLASSDLMRVEVAPPVSQPAMEMTDAAHQALLRDESLQFDRTSFVAPKPPGWLDWLGEFLAAAGPFMKWVFWIFIAALVLALIFVVVREILNIRRPLPRAKAKALEEEPWRPDVAQARDLLAAADDLARQGLFAEAVHLLLLRSVEDIQSRRPRALRVSLTTREIASLSVLPEAARPAFREIGQVVERSLFGGGDVGADEFSRCRSAYEDFAIRGWSA